MFDCDWSICLQPYKKKLFHVSWPLPILTNPNVERSSDNHIYVSVCEAYVYTYFNDELIARCAT